MKYLCYITLLALMLLVSCREEAQKKAVPVSARMGIVDGGKVINPSVIKKEWEKSTGIAEKGISIKNFRITKAVTTGSKPLVIYILEAECSDNKTMIAALLERKNDAFYFSEKAAAIMCTGSCGKYCKPKAVVKDGAVFLACTGCVECTKTEFFFNFI